LSALQPVQLVSMMDAPGATDRAAFEEFAPTRPLPHPATRSSSGANSSERFLESSLIFTNPNLHSIDFAREKREARESTVNQGTGNREQGTGNREQGTGNREQGTEKRWLRFVASHPFRKEREMDGAPKFYLLGRINKKAAS
jgi:hypothetical protein